ncbi:MAG TPA: 23S rRNA (adenine(2503)-C(2))-methyltransferase RlmN [Candidatus Limnocylindrales bacterium]|nr:23S rRNA (adenine(2503)-C(2))-methyltransferase RlmN [Candidatus Limnocylindrales bacterium]
MLSAQDLWIDEKARRAGYENGAALVSSHGLKKYRAGQLYRAAAKELVEDLDAITTLPKELRAALAAEGFALDSIEPVVVQRSRDGQTTKGLFRLHDGNEVEAVLMEHHGERNTVCISSQAGCAYACSFCSTGQAGFTRNLTATEIFDQARYFGKQLARDGRKITNVVFMGMGEPFANFDAVMGAVALLHDPQGFGLGHRHITISTVGLVDKIDRFAGEQTQVNLAISLHAPDDVTRSSIMPVNRKFSTEDLMAAVARYIAKTNRKVFFEYVMLAGVNDTDRHAHDLARLMKGPLYHVNLIPYNSTPDALLRGSDERRIWEFAKLLEQQGTAVTVRTPMGRDIAAACGQLRAETQPRAKAS